MTVDCGARDILWNAIGEWGRWQKRSVFLVFLCKIISCWCMAIILFTAPTQRSQTVRCLSKRANASSDVDETMNGNATQSYRLHEILHPEVIAPYDKPFEIDFCDLAADIGSHIDRDHSDMDLWNNTVHCDSLRYQPFMHAKRTDFDGFCSRNIVAAFTQLFFLFGVLTGGVLAWNLMNL